MPTLRKDKKTLVWVARVVVDGKQLAFKTFPNGKKHGPEWRAAKQWEEEQREKILAAQVIPSGLERLMTWGNLYLEHAERTMDPKTLLEKKNVMRDFFAFCGKEGHISAPEEISPAKAYAFLAGIRDSRSSHTAYKYRKNLAAAWTWGMDFAEAFPQALNPFTRVRPFPVIKRDRYVPPEEDVIAVLKQAQGQDLVFLLTLYYTGARRGEAFRLIWDDVDLDGGRIRLKDRKAGSGQHRVRWLRMHPELVKALSWWKMTRPCQVDNVFMRLQPATLGKPYKCLIHLMPRLCREAGVKPFGFHAIRHKSAAITFVSGGLKAAQALMGHSRATTTDGYIKSAGLYSNQDDILAALGGSGIGRAAFDLLEKMDLPQEAELPRVNCNPEYVTQ